MRRLFVAAVAVLSLAPTAQAQVLFDSGGFESYSSGFLFGQNGWNGFFTIDDFLPPGTPDVWTVQSAFAASGSQAVRVQGGNTTWMWPPIDYAPAAGERVRIQVDIAHSGINASSGYALYGIDIYDSVQETARFGFTNSFGDTFVPFVVSRFNTITGEFDPTAAPTGVLFDNITIPANTFVNFDAILNYDTKTFRLSLNGVDLGFEMPFIGLGSLDIVEADLNADVDSSLDFGYFDNYRVSVIPVPEPMTTGLVAAVAGLVFVGRRRWAAAAR